jgi:hypothetical protein
MVYLLCKSKPESNIMLRERGTYSDDVNSISILLDSDASRKTDLSPGELHTVIADLYTAGGQSTVPLLAVSHVAYST